MLETVTGDCSLTELEKSKLRDAEKDEVTLLKDKSIKSLTNQTTWVVSELINLLEELTSLLGNQSGPQGS